MNIQKNKKFKAKQIGFQIYLNVDDFFNSKEKLEYVNWKSIFVETCHNIFLYSWNNV